MSRHTTVRVLQREVEEAERALRASEKFSREALPLPRSRFDSTAHVRVRQHREAAALEAAKAEEARRITLEERSAFAKAVRAEDGRAAAKAQARHEAEQQVLVQHQRELGTSLALRGRLKAADEVRRAAALGRGEQRLGRSAELLSASRLSHARSERSLSPHSLERRSALDAEAGAELERRRRAAEAKRLAGEAQVQAARARARREHDTRSREARQLRASARESFAQLVDLEQGLVRRRLDERIGRAEEQRRRNVEEAAQRHAELQRAGSERAARQAALLEEALRRRREALARGLELGQRRAEVRARAPSRGGRCKRALSALTTYPRPSLSPPRRLPDDHPSQGRGGAAAGAPAAGARAVWREASAGAIQAEPG